MDAEPLWLTFADVDAIHAVQLTLPPHGLAGYKDDGLVRSAVVAPRNLFLYDGEDDILVLAIHLCFAIAKNHGFLDGNKRTAAAAMIEFLAINGYDLFVPDDDPEEPLLGRWVEKLVVGAYDVGQMYDLLEHFVQDAVG